MFRSRGVSAYRASEAHVLLADRFWKPDGSRRGVIFAHGVSGTADDWTGGGVVNQLRAIIAAGYPVLSADLCVGSGGQNWGNDDHIDAMDDARAFLVAQGAAADMVGVFASSMGAAGALGWARQHLADVFAVAAQIPTLDLDAIYQGNLGGFRAQVGTAHGVTYPTALPNLATHSPVAFGATDLLDLPIGLWTSATDPTATNTAAAQAWAAGAHAGADLTITDLGDVGHSAATVDPDDVVAFLDDAGGRA